MGDHPTVRSLFPLAFPCDAFPNPSAPRAARLAAPRAPRPVASRRAAALPHPPQGPRRLLRPGPRALLHLLHAGRSSKPSPGRLGRNTVTARRENTEDATFSRSPLPFLQPYCFRCMVLPILPAGLWPLYGSADLPGLLHAQGLEHNTRDHSER